jgi:outer membrane protein
MRMLAIAAIFLMTLTGANAQQKIGHADWAYIFGHLPEVKQIQRDLKSHELQLQNKLNAGMKDFESKVQAYRSLPNDTPGSVIKERETELLYFEDSLKKLREEAQASLRKKEMDLMAPVFEKVGKTIEVVARENGYSYIFNPQVMGGGDVLLFSDEKDNISDLVLKKMGITSPQHQSKTE